MSSSQVPAYHFVSPVKQVYIGIWTLFGGASIFLGFRIWCKVTHRFGLWYDDYILFLSWVRILCASDEYLLGRLRGLGPSPLIVENTNAWFFSTQLVLLTTNAIITTEMNTGYVSKTWDDRMLILITISSCGTTIGQTLSKTAFAVTLLRLIQESQKICQYCLELYCALDPSILTEGLSRETVVWFCIVTLNVLMVLKVFMNWPKYCGNKDYQNYWRMQGFCVDYGIATGVKIAGNIWNIVMDFALALFPWIVIWKLNIKRWEKVGLCATLSLGIIVAIISAIRQAWQDNPANSKLDDWYYCEFTLWRSFLVGIMGSDCL